MSAFRCRAAGFAVVAISITACQMDTPANQAVPYKGKAAHVCIEGCQDPPVVMTLYANLGYGGSIAGDTVFLPDSSYYLGEQASLAVSIGDTTAAGVEVGTSIGSSCSTSCIIPTTFGEPISPSTVSIDSHSTYDYVYWTWQTEAPGTGTLFLSAGATELDLPVVVYHCSYRLSCSRP